jgi:predicted RNA-binding Zn ribbon-like protein
MVPDPAMVPGTALRLIQSFASTRGAAPDADLLRTREDATSWLRAMALLPGEAALTNSEHAALVRLRSSIGDILAAHADDRQDADAAARLTRALADGRLVLTVEDDSTVRLASAARASYSHVVAAIAVAIAGCAAAGQWRRLKACVTAGCGQVFYDDSPSAGARRCPAHAGAG